MYYASAMIGDRSLHVEYHNCQTLNSDDRDVRIINNLISVQADDSELTRIQDLFGDTIPFPKGHRVVTWYGDIAKCIHSAMIRGDMFGYR